MQCAETLFGLYFPWTYLCIDQTCSFLWLWALQVVFLGINTVIEMSPEVGTEMARLPCIWGVILIVQDVLMLMSLDDHWNENTDFKNYPYCSLDSSVTMTADSSHWNRSTMGPTLLPCPSQPFHTHKWEMHRAQLMSTGSRGQGRWCLPVWLFSAQWASVLSEETTHCREIQAFLLGSVTQQQQEKAGKLAVPELLVSFWAWLTLGLNRQE